METENSFFQLQPCYEAWHFVSYREWDKGGVGLYSAATNSERECLQQISVLALATLYSRDILCALLHSPVYSNHFCQTFEKVGGASNQLKEQLAGLYSCEISLCSCSGIGAAPFRSSLSSTVY